MIFAVFVVAAFGPGLDSGLHAQADTESLEGVWAGTITHNGQATTFGLRFEVVREDSARVHLYMPEIGFRDVFAGTALVSDSRIVLGSWMGEWDSNEERVRGLVPAAVLPAYEVPFELSRVDSIPAGPPPAPLSSPEPRWTLDVGGSVWSGLAFAEDRLLVATDAGEVSAIDEDGHLLWSVDVGAPVRATPTVVAGRVFVHADDGRVSVLDLTSGDRIWAAEIGAAAERIAPGSSESRYDHYASSVRIGGDLAFVGAYDGAVVALRAQDGEVVWRLEESSSVLGTPAIDGERLIYATFDGEVVAVGVRDGHELWRTEARGAISSAPVVHDGRVIIGTRSYDVLGLRVEDGTVDWTYYYWWSWVESSAVVLDGTAYIGSSDAQRVNAIDAASGALEWSTRVEGSAWSSPAVTEGAVYVGSVGVAGYSTDHRGRFFKLDRSTGLPEWRYEVDPSDGASTWGIASTPVLGKRGVYAATIGGRLLAFRF
jgi:outer membrane protein assembly factor BamB